MRIASIVFCGLFILGGCATSPVPKVVVESILESAITLPCQPMFVDLQGNFLGSADEGENRYSSPVPKGQIRIEYHYARPSEQAGEPRRAGFWKAGNECTARAITRALDDFETLPGDVATYKTKGKYPYYKQELIKGGCDHGELNCSD